MTKKKEAATPAPLVPEDERPGVNPGEVSITITVPKNMLDSDRQQLRAALGQLALEQLLAPENAEDPA